MASSLSCNDIWQGKISREHVQICECESLMCVKAQAEMTTYMLHFSTVYSLCMPIFLLWDNKTHLPYHQMRKTRITNLITGQVRDLHLEIFSLIWMQDLMSLLVLSSHSQCCEIDCAHRPKWTDAHSGWARDLIWSVSSKQQFTFPYGVMRYKTLPSLWFQIRRAAGNQEVIQSKFLVTDWPHLFFH